MAVFRITGGKKLRGDIYPQGAKNEALQILSAVLLTKNNITIRNIPRISDVLRLIELLMSLGVKVTQINEHDYTFQAKDINLDYLNSKEFLAKSTSLRGSIMIIGPLLARFGKGFIPSPGGDKIGRRRLDTHFIGFQNLGAEFSFDTKTSSFTVTAKKLHGAYMLLDEASVTGTANIIMAAVLAEGTTTIYNAACEPYIQQLCKMLNAMGAKISGIASNLLTIEGVSELGGCEHTILPDMIEVGSFMGLAAMTGSEITIKNVSYDDLGIIPQSFARLGVQFERRGDDIFIPAQDVYTIPTFIDGSIMHLADAPWPGLTPDLLSVLLVVATQASGSRVATTSSKIGRAHV